MSYCYDTGLYTMKHNSYIPEINNPFRRNPLLANRDDVAYNSFI